MVQEVPDAEVRQRRTEEHRGLKAFRDLLLIKLFRSPVQKLHVLAEFFGRHFSDDLRGVLEVRERHDGSGQFMLAGILCVELGDVLRPAVVDALESLACADGPGDGTCMNAEHMLDLIQKREGVVDLAVHLVDEGENGDVAEDADFEQFDGLRLHALRTVDHHDRGIGGHERAVGVLGEILMAGGVQQVDAVAVIVELKHRGGHGDTPLLLDLHPVGDRMLLCLSAFDRTGGIDRAAVEQEFFCQCRLARVRMRDDRKGAAASDLIVVLSHNDPLLSQ